MNTLKLLACFLVPISVVGLIIGILVCMSVGYFGVGMFCGFLAYTIFVFWWLMITGIGGAGGAISESADFTPSLNAFCQIAVCFGVLSPLILSFCFQKL